jgi:hypothetical protein
MDFLVVAKSSVRAISIEFNGYVDAKDSEKKGVHDKIHPVIGEYIDPKENFESFGTIYIQPSDVTGKFLTSIKKTGVGATLSYIEEKEYFPYGSKVRKTKKKIPKSFLKLGCSKTGETVTIEFLYPKRVLKLLKRIDEVREKIVDPWADNPEMDRLVEQIKDMEKALFAIYKPLIKKYDLGYNEVSYASDLTFKFLFCDKKFSEKLYKEVANLLPAGYGMRVNQTIYYSCNI